MLNVINNQYYSGFKMTFENGYTISVQFGTGNYCENRSFSTNQVDTDIPKSCANAEIAIWDSNNKWFNFGNDEVMGWVSADDIADWIYRVKNAESLETI